MCDLCLCSPCLPGCPNREEPTYRTCKKCGDPIPVGLQVIDLDGDIYCEDCVNDMSPADVFHLLGYDFEENIIPEPDYPEPEPWEV